MPVKGLRQGRRISCGEESFNPVNKLGSEQSWRCHFFVHHCSHYHLHLHNFYHCNELDKILRSYNQKRLPRLDLFSTELKFASVLSQSVGCQVSKNSTTAHPPFLHSLDRSIPGIVKQGRYELPRPPSLLLQILQDHRLTPVWSW